jgi:hypothetical protein
MKLLKIAMALSLIMVIASSAFGVCAHKPKDGIYSTTTSSMLAGRASEAFCGGVAPGVTVVGFGVTDVGPGLPGNTENAMSWDGVVLGGQWHIWGMTIDAAGAVETGQVFDAYGNGWRDYVTNYTGGLFWLSGAHTWGDGLGDFTGTITYYNVGAKVSYVGWVPVGITANTSLRGSFDSCNYCFIDYGVANTLLIWRTGDMPPMPANYPPFLCGANAGELHDVCDVTISIFCDVTATQPSTWGTIKELFR